MLARQRRHRPHAFQKLMAEGFDGVIVIATNPVDVLTFIVQKESGLPASHVIRLRHASRR